VSSGTTMSNTINALSSPTSNVASQPAASSNNDTDLSTGATAGVATGAIIGFIVLAVLGFMVWRKRKVYKLPSMVHGDNSSMHQDEFISSQSRDKDIHGHQNIPAELEPHSKPQELPGSYVVT
jgi:LPXTG-motif cell wall-anchored protein